MHFRPALLLMFAATFGSALFAAHFPSLSENTLLIQMREELKTKGGSLLKGSFQGLRSGKYTFLDDELGTLKVAPKDLAALSLSEEIQVFFQRTEEDSIHLGKLDGQGQYITAGDQRIPFTDDNFFRVEREEYSLWQREGRLSFGFDLSEGNSRGFGYAGNASFKLSYRRHAFRASLDGAYAEEFGKRSSQYAQMTLEYNYLLGDTFGAYIRKNLEHDAFKAIQIKNTDILGLNKYIFKQASMAWRVEAGYALTTENRKDLPNEVYGSAQVGTFFEVQALEKIKLEAKSDLFWELFSGSKDNLEMISRLAVHLQTWENFTTSLAFQHSFDNQPPAGQRRSDLKIHFLLGWSF